MRKRIALEITQGDSFVTTRAAHCEFADRRCRLARGRSMRHRRRGPKRYSYRFDRFELQADLLAAGTPMADAPRRYRSPKAMAAAGV
jgi:hypothetical protein